jgi:predicted Zn-dependent protease
MSGSKTKGLLWLVGAILLAVGMALGLPYFAKHIPWSVEKRLAGVFGGSPANAPCQGRSHPESKALLQTLVKRIYPLYPEDSALPITIEVIPGKTVNAFAMLGGRIYVYDGLLKQAESPEELAGVLAHEIEHVRNRHIMQAVAVNLFTIESLKLLLPGGQQLGPQLAYLLLNLKFGRQQEYEADEMGLQRLQQGQVDAEGFRQFFARAEKLPATPQILSNHPANEFREQLAESFRGYPVVPIMDQAQWQTLKTICQ